MHKRIIFYISQKSIKFKPTKYVQCKNRSHSEMSDRNEGFSALEIHSTYAERDSFHKFESRIDIFTIIDCQRMKATRCWKSYFVLIFSFFEAIFGLILQYFKQIRFSFMLSWAIYKYTSIESTYILFKKIDSLYTTRFKMKKKLFLHHYVQLSYSKLEKGEL